MYEHRAAPLLPFPDYLARLGKSAAIAGVLVFGSLGLGVAGYRFIGHLGWVDAVLNASMILTGMGPVDPMPTPAAKLFASAYALFSGVAFLSIVGVLLAPIAHRFLHRFHIEGAAEEQPSDPRRAPPD